MVYDCFLFFNELKILELRLEELSSVVDQFVLVESTRTFSNDTKPLHFQQNRRGFSKYAHKIRHIVVDEVPQHYGSAWDAEHFQRDAITRGLEDAKPDDLIIISDVDEIPRREVVRSFTGNVAALELDFFYYKLNYKNLTMKWVAPVLIRRSRLRSPEQSRQHARHYWENGIAVLPNAGWHFSYMQGPGDIALKLKSFSHQECNTPEFTDLDGITHKIKYGLDLTGRPDHFWCCVPLDASFPAYLVEKPRRFRELIANFNEFHVNRQLLISSLYQNLDKAKAKVPLVLPSADVLLDGERRIRLLLNELSTQKAELVESKKHIARLQVEFDEKAQQLQDSVKKRELLADRLQESQKKESTLQSRIQELSILWSKSTRWKRAFVFLALAAIEFAAGVSLICTEAAGRILRRARRRNAPLAAPANPNRCSIIMLSWEGKDLLAESLPPLLKAVQFDGGDHEIIVLDNGSTDGTCEYVQEQFPEVRVVRSERNIFFTGGNNLGVQAAKNDVVVLLNNDMLVHKDFLRPLLQGFHQPDVFAVGSQVFLADPKQRREETGKTRARFNGCDLDWGHDPILTSDEERKYVPVFWGHGGAVALDKQKFLWLGGFDTLFDPFYVEDADLSYRAWKVGWRCLLAVDSRVIHKHRGTNTPRYGSRFVTQITRRNQYVFFWKNVGDFDKLANHFLRSPRKQMREAGVPGIGSRFEAKVVLGALARLPAILKRKLRMAGSVARTDEEVQQTINTPAPEVIRAAEVDFKLADYAEQLGAGWYARDQAGGTGFRWMSQSASIFLRAPAEIAELYLEGYASGQPDRSPPTLVVNFLGQRTTFKLPEGYFERRCTVAGVAPGTAVRIHLAVNRTFTTPLDGRELGIIFHRIGLSVGTGSQDHHEELNAIVSVRNILPSTSAERAGQRRILMICPYLPCLGVHGGGNMMFHLIRTLSKRNRLSVLAFYERDEERRQVAQLAPFCERLDAIYRGQSFEYSNLLGLKPPEIVNEFYHRRMSNLVEEYIRTEAFDLIQCEYLQTAHFANSAPSIPAVLTIHELLSLSYSDRYHALPWRFAGKKLSALTAWMRMLDYQDRWMRRFAGVVVLTEREKAFLAQYAPGVNVYQHPMGVDCEFFQPDSLPPEPTSVVFVGNFRHQPNLQGATWFLRQVWPRIRARYREARLYLVGGEPPESLREVDGTDGVSVTGFVKDVRPYLERAAVFVAPIFEGAGLRTKVLEAWAMRKPVVGTRLAFEGLTSEDGEICRLAEDEESFADRVCELFDNVELAIRVGLRARDFVISRFAWQDFASLYERIYDDVLGPAKLPRVSESGADTDVVSEGSSR